MRQLSMSIGLVIGIIGLYSCQEGASSYPRNNEVISEQFNNYWYAGKAEVVSYNLNQSRYGEERQGKAVLIFVTEPFSGSKQVKLDDPDKAGGDKVSVMKLNFVKKFTTGIYPYSMMLSSFTPVDLATYPNTLKVSMSSQEWCGHVYSQMNLSKKGYKVKSFSYFEKEGDEEFTTDKVFLEDEVWNRIRLNYKSLPTGKIKILPGLFYTRLLHQQLTPEEATATITENNGNASYTIKYPRRKLSINFETNFPFKINSWEESFPGLNGKTAVTSATFDKMLYIDYWTKNKKRDVYLRDSLDLAP